MVILVLSGWPFYKLVAKRERAVVGWAPLFIVVRSLAFAAGVAAGLVGMPFFRPTRSAVRPCEPVAQS